MSKVWWFIGGIGLVAIFNKEKLAKGMKDLTLNIGELIQDGIAKIRKDAGGDGHYGARRGNRKHNGVDLKITPGQLIYAPFKAKIVREAFPYAGDKNYHGIYLQSTENANIKMKMFYLRKLPSLKSGDIVEKGKAIAKAENITAKYGGSMTPHIHVEVFENNNRVNPELYLNT